MPIEFNCVCGNAFCVDDIHAGRTGTCPKCKMPITVPGELVQPDAGVDSGPRFPPETIMAYLQMHHASNIFVLYPHVPPAREAAARAYFNIPREEVILAIFHPSLLVAGEETMALSNLGFYVKKADLTLGRGSYESLLEGSIHLEGTRDLVLQAVKPERYRMRVLVPPGIAEYLSKILRGLQLALNGRDPSPIFTGESATNALQELRAERQGLLPTATMQGGNSGSGGTAKRGILGALRGKGRNP